MSLVGNLEDLGLGDILQIVSLSRKSGVLSLSSRDREGRIAFRNGQVIRATSSVLRENVGDLLLNKGLVTLDVLKKAVLIQRSSEQPPRLGKILADRFGVSGEQIEEVVKEHIEKIIYSFFAWGEGTFAFELGDSEELGTTNLNPLQFMLDQGLNPQWLAMEGSRILDEKRHRGESLDPEPEPPAPGLEQLLTVPAEPATAGEGGPEPMTAPAEGAPGTDCEGLIYLVDDDRLTREVLADLLHQRGLTCRTFAGGRDLLAALEGAMAGGGTPALLVDLIMPRMDGSGILGGLELAEAIRRRYPQLVPLMMSDHTNAEAEQRARQLGIQEIFAKPKRGDLRQPRGEQLLETLGDALAERFGSGERGPVTPGGAGQFHLGEELFRELGVADAADARGGPENSPGLHLLRGMLQELNNPALGGGILLLVLRFASELMNRAVVFFVKGESIVGLGQFGIEGEGHNADARVRQIAVPAREDSLFRAALEQRAPLRAVPGDGAWDVYLREQLGGRKPAEVFLGPILNEGQVVAILYGDNLPGTGPIGDTEALEIFLSQAGLAMEKAILERRLQGLDGS